MKILRSEKSQLVTFLSRCAPLARALRERIAGGGGRPAAGGRVGRGSREFIAACGEMVEQVACLVVECLGLKLGDRLTFSD